ncbi:MAG: HAD family hydrolase [Acidimicrobiales bacterium]
MTISAVLLDVGGVLVLPDPDVLEPVVRPFAPNVTAEALARGHYHAIAAMDRAAWAKGVTADWPVYNRAMVETLGIAVDAQGAAASAIAEAFVRLVWRRVIPESVAALAQLAATGVRIGIVSNADGTIEQQLMASGICQVGAGDGVEVTAIVDSGALGVEKPDPAIFHHALEVIGVTADEAIHVGDTAWADVAGARAAGVRPVHFDPYGLCPQVDDHDHVADLEGVIQLLSV